jgi:hypothetical protein
VSCASCAQRREAIAKIAREVGGAIVFGAKRVLSRPAPAPQSKDEDGKR